MDALNIFKAGQAPPGGHDDAHAASREHRADLSFFCRVVEHDDAVALGARYLPLCDAGVHG